MNRVRLAVLAVVLAVAPASMSGTPAAGAPLVAVPAMGHLLRSAAAVVGHGGAASAVRQAALRTLAPPPGRPARIGLPFLTRDPRAVAAAKASPRASRNAVRAVLPRSTAAAPPISGHVFLSHDIDLQMFGQDIEPPDTQVAAGLADVIEMVNSAGVILSKDTLGPDPVYFDLDTFFPLDPGLVLTDPRVLFDAESGRWFTSGLGFSPSTLAPSQVLLGMSTSAEPRGGWVFLTLDRFAGDLCDQPKLGVSSDKVMLSCSIFDTSSRFIEERTYFINKAEMIALGLVHWWFYDAPGLFSVVPVTSLAPTPIAYTVENDSRLGSFCGPGLVVLTAVSGVPGASTPLPQPGNRNDLCFPMTATAVPPAARQPAGGSATIDTGDDRFLSAAWWGGALWTGGNDSCTPPGDTQPRPCLRLASISTLDDSIVSTDVTIGGLSIGSVDLFYPAVTMDGFSDLFVGYSQSSPVIPATIGGLDIPAGSLTPDPIPLANLASSPSYTGTRWGDYSGAAADPDGRSAWVAGESASTSSTSTARVWSTVIQGPMTMPPPELRSLNQSSGPAAGGQPFSMTGRFRPGATVSFAGNLATGVVVGPNLDTLTGVTPSGPPGPAPVMVTDPDGSHAICPCAQYQYNAPAAAAQTFFFSEGNTLPGFNETLYLFMPNTAGTAQITYFTDRGVVGPISHALSAGEVAPISVAQDLGAGLVGVSAQVVLPGPGVAERMLNFTTGTWHGSTDVVGVAAPKTLWNFAEGSTLPAFSEFLTLQNPDPATAADVSISYFTDRGAVIPKTLVLPPTSRTTVEVFKGGPSTACSIVGGVAQGCGAGPNLTGVSTQVQVTGGPAVVAERPMYVNGFDFGSGPVRDGHDAFGANGAAATWSFAEGTTIGGFNEYLTLLNPDVSTASSVHLDYFTDQGVHVTKTLTLPHSSRTTVEVFKGAQTSSSCALSGGVAQLCGVGPGVTGVSTRVSVVSGPGIVAERPIYLSVDFGTGVVAGAHDAVGATSLGTLFGFASVQTTAGEDDFLTILNSNTQPANVILTYYDAAAGFPRSAPVVVFPNSRRTVRLFLPPGSGPGGIGPGLANIGIVVSSDQPILVEKPTYNSTAARYGATDTIGFSPSPAF